MTCLNRMKKQMALKRSLPSNGAILLLSILLAACVMPPPPPPPVVWSVSEDSRASIDGVLLAPAKFKLQPVVSVPAKGAIRTRN